MPHFAAVVVVEAKDAEEAQSYMLEGGVRESIHAAQGVFVGDPWEVEPIAGVTTRERPDGATEFRVPTGHEFDTLGCIQQQPRVKAAARLIDTLLSDSNSPKRP